MESMPRKRSRGGKFLTVFGAFIVFVTFIVKDGISEHLKDITDAIHTAENTFQIRSTESEIAERVNVVNQTLSRIYSKEMANGDVGMDRLAMYMSLSSMFTRSQRNQTEQLDGLTELIETLPPDDQRETQLNKFADEIELLGEQVTQLDTAPKNEEDWWDKNHGNRIEMTIFTEQRDLTKFSDKILTQAREIRKFEEQRLQMATYASYALYVLGWGLALVGRLSGGGDIFGGD